MRDFFVSLLNINQLLMYLSKPIKPTDTVFLGDSLTESFDLQKHFGRDDLRNRGMSGNMTEHVLYRLEEITNAKPKFVFLMIGINDLYQGMDFELVISNIKTILVEIRTKTPESKLLVQSILPVNEDKLLIDSYINKKIYEANNRIRSICNEMKISFIDIHPDFLNETGQMDTLYTYDGVHLTEAGYIHWAELIQEYL